MRNVTEDTFTEDVLAAERPVLVDFYADWCGPCRNQKQVLEAAAPDLRERVDVVKVDVDREPGLARQFGVKSIPTLVLFRNGRGRDHAGGTHLARRVDRPPGRALRHGGKLVLPRYLHGKTDSIFLCKHPSQPIAATTTSCLCATLTRTRKPSIPSWNDFAQAASTSGTTKASGRAPNGPTSSRQPSSSARSCSSSSLPSPPAHAIVATRSNTPSITTLPSWSCTWKMRSSPRDWSSSSTPFRPCTKRRPAKRATWSSCCKPSRTTRRPQSSRSRRPTASLTRSRRPPPE